MRYTEVDVKLFIDPDSGEPAHGRGAWTSLGIGTGYRYQLRKGVRVGNEAEKSLGHWAVSAAVGAIQQRLADLGAMEPVTDDNRGNFGRATENGVREFQADHSLPVDGTIGRTDAKMLFGLLIDSNQTRHAIPDHLLRGLLMQESALDPGAVGYYTFYDTSALRSSKDLHGIARAAAAIDAVLEPTPPPTYAGVDRGLAQINSKAHPTIGWEACFDPGYAVNYAGQRLRSAFGDFTHDHPDRPIAMRWDAAVCQHNSPARASAWMHNGYPSPEAAAYVAAVKKARW